jgi:hypothetical protein
MSAGVEQVYRYVQPSFVGVLDGRPDVRLATSGGVTTRGLADHPRFFDGFLGHAEQMAAALLAVARVARTRYYVPPGMLAAVLRAADPVVTSNGDRLRFESFSACCGVYARLDVLPEALDGPALDTGTTNVDFNPPMRQALAGIDGLDPLHLSVGEDVTVTTLEESVTEKRVPLPERWLKGFAEVQVAASTMVPVLEIPAVEARRFVQSLPRATGARTAMLWAVPAGRGLRLTGRAGPGVVCLAGPERLRVLEPLLRFGSALRAYAPAVATPGAPSASVWELDLRGARLSVTLSPEVSRGFSGEGGVLRDLADPASSEDSELIVALLAFEPRLDVADLGRRAGIDEGRVLRAFGRLGAAGRVGFDARESAFFHRELPYDATALEAMHPRLRDARALIEEGAVRLEGELAYVGTEEPRHVVRRTPTGHRCSCPWYGRHQDNRGPCKHVLAVELTRRG